MEGKTGIFPGLPVRVYRFGIFSVQSGSFTFLLRYRLHVPDPIEDESSRTFSFYYFVIPYRSTPTAKLFCLTCIRKT